MLLYLLYIGDASTKNEMCKFVAPLRNEISRRQVSEISCRDGMTTPALLVASLKEERLSPIAQGMKLNDWLLLFEAQQGVHNFAHHRLVLRREALEIFRQCGDRAFSVAASLFFDSQHTRAFFVFPIVQPMRGRL
jgi:hypothetical protein